MHFNLSSRNPGHSGAPKTLRDTDVALVCRKIGVKGDLGADSQNRLKVSQQSTR